MSPSPRDAEWRELVRELEAEGFRPTKERGQNFLVDPNLARALVRDAGVRPGDRVLEVGPGCGFLTRPLTELGVELVAAEIEPRLARIAARRVEANGRGTARFVVGDVLDGKHALAPEVAALFTEGPWHVVSNLPYAISGPFVAVLAALANPPSSMSLVVQREVAERLAAEPGEAAWGALSAKVRLLYRGRLGRTIGASMFWPRPRVESRLVRLELDPDRGPALESADRALYVQVVDALFSQRRKTVRNGLKSALGAAEAAERVLAAAGVDPGRRPGELDVPALLGLVRAIRAEPAPGPGARISWRPACPADPGC